MERVRDDGMWSLFCPDICPGLSDVYGDEYKQLYLKYEADGKYIHRMKAQDIWKEVCISQKETGTPYICFKDNVNKKNNQMNVGVIKSSNLCSEIMEYSDDKETAVCNLASIVLPTFIENGKFNFDKLIHVVKIVCKNLNKTIDCTYYPVIDCERSNKRHRPIGIGVSGLADCYAILNYPFNSPDPKELNRSIFETMYYAALTMSMELSKKYGPYDSFDGSPASKGILQFDMWDINPKDTSKMDYDWDSLKNDIKKYGMRNSLLIALMPTASTSQIMGVSECFEPLTSNVFSRKTLSGEFIIVNKYLVKTLVELNLWNKEIKNKIILNDGSIQNIQEIPTNVKNIFKTSYEIGSKAIIDQMAERGPYVDQSASMNLFMFEPEINQISNAHFYSWKKGIKTGCYYCRTKQVAKSGKFNQEAQQIKKENITEQMECLS